MNEYLLKMFLFVIVDMHLYKISAAERYLKKKKEDKKNYII